MRPYGRLRRRPRFYAVRTVSARVSGPSPGLSTDTPSGGSERFGSWKTHSTGPTVTWGTLGAVYGKGERVNTLIVMAAGMGSRYGGLKQMEPVGPNGEIILDYSAYDALATGFERLVFVVRDEFVDAFRRRMNVRFAGERFAYACQRLSDVPGEFVVPPDRTKPWGTAHAVYACRDEIDGPFAVVNADDFYGRGAFALLHEFLQHRVSDPDVGIGLVGYPLHRTLSDSGTVSRGVCRVAADGTLLEIVERKQVGRRDGVVGYPDARGEWVELPDDSVVSMNAWAFSQSFLDVIERRFPSFLRDHGGDPTSEFLLPTVVGQLVARGEAAVNVLSTDEQWFGITYRDDLDAVRRGIAVRIESGVYPATLAGRG